MELEFNRGQTRPPASAEVHQPWAGKGCSASIMNSSLVPNTSESFDGAIVPAGTMGDHRRRPFGLSATLAYRPVAEAAVGPSGLVPVRLQQHQCSIYSP